MKTFVLKCMTVFIFVFIGSLFMVDMFIFGDKITINEIESKNYNGYLPLKEEDKIIELGFQYDYSKSLYNLYTYEHFIIEVDIILNGQYYVFIQDDNESIYMGYAQRLSVYGSNLYITIDENNQLYGQTSNGLDIYIFGISNYEVQP
jgi:hypothetical protein